MSLAESATDETLFNNQAAIVGSKLLTFAELLFQYLVLNEDSNKQRPAAVPYIATVQWSTACTNSTLPPAPTDGMNEGHARTHSKWNQPHTDQQQALTAVQPHSVLLLFTALRHCLIGSLRSKCQLSER
jgi:hypothetical protein